MDHDFLGREVDDDGYTFLSNIDRSDYDFAEKAKTESGFDIKIKKFSHRGTNEYCSVWSKDKRSHEPFWDLYHKYQGGVK